MSINSSQFTCHVCTEGGDLWQWRWWRVQSTTQKQHWMKSSCWNRWVPELGSILFCFSILGNLHLSCAWYFQIIKNLCRNQTVQWIWLQNNLFLCRSATVIQMIQAKRELFSYWMTSRFQEWMVPVSFCGIKAKNCRKLLGQLSCFGKQCPGIPFPAQGNLL